MSGMRRGALGRLCGLGALAVLVLAAAAIPLSASAAPPHARPRAPDLAAEVLAKVEATKEYSQISAFAQDHARSRYGWDSYTAEVINAALAGMRSDAAHARIVKTPKGLEVDYSVGGVFVADTKIDIASLSRDPDYRSFVAAAIADVIVSDSKVRSLFAAVKDRTTDDIPRGQSQYYMVYVYMDQALNGLFTRYGAPDAKVHWDKVSACGSEYSIDDGYACQWDIKPGKRQVDVVVTYLSCCKGSSKPSETKFTISGSLVFRPEDRKTEFPDRPEHGEKFWCVLVHRDSLELMSKDDPHCHGN